MSELQWPPKGVMVALILLGIWPVVGILYYYCEKVIDGLLSRDGFNWLDDGPRRPPKKKSIFVRGRGLT